MNITTEQLQCILEAAIMVAGRPLTIAHMIKLFDEPEQPSTIDIQAALQGLRERYQSSGIELCESASGFQFQAKTELSSWLCRLWEEKPPRYSRALLETLALIAYRQPITRAEVEEIRGVGVSSHIIKTLQEREWVRIIGYHDLPGKPALYGTTKAFLDHFNLKSLDQLPTLAELKDLDVQEAKLQVQLELTEMDTPQEEGTPAEPTTMDAPLEEETPSELTVMDAPQEEETQSEPVEMDVSQEEGIPSEPQAELTSVEMPQEEISPGSSMLETSPHE